MYVCACVDVGPKIKEMGGEGGQVHMAANR